MAGDEEEACMCVLACSFRYCVYSHNLARTFPYLEANFPVCLQFGYTTSSMIRRDHAKSAESDFSAKANSFCFVACATGNSCKACFGGWKMHCTKDEFWSRKEFFCHFERFAARLCGSHCAQCDNLRYLSRHS